MSASRRTIAVTDARNDVDTLDHREVEVTEPHLAGGDSLAAERQIENRLTRHRLIIRKSLTYVERAGLSWMCRS